MKLAHCKGGVSVGQRGIALEALGPDLGLVLSADQLRRKTDSVPIPLDSTLNYVVGLQFAPDLADGLARSGESFHRILRDHTETLGVEAAEDRDHFGMQAVSKVALFRIG